MVSHTFFYDTLTYPIIKPTCWIAVTNNMMTNMAINQGQSLNNYMTNGMNDDSSELILDPFTVVVRSYQLINSLMIVKAKMKISTNVTSDNFCSLVYLYYPSCLWCFQWDCVYVYHLLSTFFSSLNIVVVVMLVQIEWFHLYTGYLCLFKNWFATKFLNIFGHVSCQLVVAFPSMFSLTMVHQIPNFNNTVCYYIYLYIVWFNLYWPVLWLRKKTVYLKNHIMASSYR